MLVGLDCLGEYAPKADLNVVHTQVDSHGVGQPESWQLRRRVQAVTDMQYRSGETHDHPLPMPPIPLEVSMKLCRTLSRRIY